MNERQAGDLEEQIRSGKAAIVSSKHGGGKSTFIKSVFFKIGYEVLEYDVSLFTTDEWDELEDLVGIKLGDSIIYIPSIDRAKESRLLKIVKGNNDNAIVMETSKTWGLKELRGYCRDIVIDVPDWRQMTEIMKQRGTYTGKTPQNLYHVYGDGDFERVESEWSLTAKFFSGESVKVDTKFLPWIIDNASNFLEGYDLFRFLHYSAKIGATGRVDMISGLAQRGRGEVERPYFHKKLGLARNDER